MRIAVSGTHRVGKSTLIEELGGSLPGYRAVPEPYELLLERGYDFAHPPTVEDFVVQLKQSLALLRRPLRNALFDRCPLDFVAYISATPGGERFDVERWRQPIAAALASLDLIVFAPIDPRHDPFSNAEDAAFRAAVDLELCDLINDDTLDLLDELPVLSLTGAWDRRATTVLARIDQLRRQA